MITRLLTRVPYRCSSFTTTKPDIQVLISKSTNIYMNLATEEFIFEKSMPLIPTLLLYRDAKTVVIGKHQNPWKECNLSAMRKDKIQLARRKSGGGAVYHDLGNACFSFMDPLGDLPKNIDFKEINASVITESLINLGLPDIKRGTRGDVTVRDLKVSGSAFQLKPAKRTLHHGTMLINEDKIAIHKYLTPSLTKLKCKGIDSVRSQIANLTEYYPNITYKSYCDSLIESYMRKHEGKKCEIRILEEEEMKQIPEIMSIYKRIIEWKWKYGETPHFEYCLERSFDWGNIEISFNVDNAMITNGQIKSDNTDTDFLMLFNTLLQNPNVKHEKDGWEAITEQMKYMCKRDSKNDKMIEDIKEMVASKL